MMRRLREFLSILALYDLSAISSEFLSVGWVHLTFVSFKKLVCFIPNFSLAPKEIIKAFRGHLCCLMSVVLSKVINRVML